MMADALAAPGLHALLGYQLAQASIATQRLFRSVVGQPQDLRPVEYSLLVLIAGNPAVPASRLARELAVTKPQITMWLDRLEGRGLIKRQPSRTDGRSLALHATAAGARLAAACTAKLHEAERAAFAHLSSGESTMLLELLAKLAQAR
jgi:DNA-binding MarR family transcriptional regulator